MCRRKRAINNNNVVNIDLNIENVLPNDNTNTLMKQLALILDRFSNHIYEEVDYESDMKCQIGGTVKTANYENVFTGDKGPDNEYGKQVTNSITIIFLIILFFI